MAFDRYEGEHEFEQPGKRQMVTWSQRRALLWIALVFVGTPVLLVIVTALVYGLTVLLLPGVTP